MIVDTDEDDILKYPKKDYTKIYKIIFVLSIPIFFYIAFINNKLLLFFFLAFFLLYFARREKHTELRKDLSLGILIKNNKNTITFYLLGIPLIAIILILFLLSFNWLIESNIGFDRSVYLILTLNTGIFLSIVSEVILYYLIQFHGDKTIEKNLGNWDQHSTDDDLEIPMNKEKNSDNEYEYEKKKLFKIIKKSKRREKLVGIFDLKKKKIGKSFIIMVIIFLSVNLLLFNGVLIPLENEYKRYETDLGGGKGFLDITYRGKSNYDDLFTISIIPSAELNYNSCIKSYSLKSIYYNANEKFNGNYLNFPETIDLEFGIVAERYSIKFEGNIEIVYYNSENIHNVTYPIKFTYKFRDPLEIPLNVLVCFCEILLIFATKRLIDKKIDKKIKIILDTGEEK